MEGAPIPTHSDERMPRPTGAEESPERPVVIPPPSPETRQVAAPATLDPLPITDRQRIRCYVAYLLLILVFLALLGRLAWIQCLQHDWYVRIAGKLHQDEIILPARRGMILDRNGRTLAITTEVNSVFADPALIADKDRTASVLTAILGGDVHVLRQKLEKGKRFAWIQRKVSDACAEAIAKQNLPGIGFIKEDKRSYPCGMLACHVLGFVDMDNTGREGIELLFDHCLSGTPGSREVERDGRLNHLGGADLGYKPPMHGYSIVLTLDAVIQEIVEQELDAACAQWKPLGASAIVVAPPTGEILAMASRPAYDPNCFGQFPLDSIRNRAITDSYEPGSTFKPFIAASVLDEKLATVDTIYDCHRGAFRIGPRVLHDHHPYDKLTFPEVISKSSNIGMAQMGLALGCDKLYGCVVRHGFGLKTGIELPGEVTGMVRPKEKWTSYSITSVPMGQEVSVTPLQLATAFSAYANGGMLLMPRVVRGVADNSGKRIQKLFPTPVKVRRVCSVEVVQEKIGPILVQVIEEGTGRRAQSRSYQVAGKTGTSQKMEPDGTYSHTRFVGSIVGYAPASDPAICVLVVLDEPHGEYYGGTVAAPVLGQIIDRVLGYMRVEGDVTRLANR